MNTILKVAVLALFCSFPLLLASDGPDVKQGDRQIICSRLIVGDGKSQTTIEPNRIAMVSGEMTLTIQLTPADAVAGSGASANIHIRNGSRTFKDGFAVEVNDGQGATIVWTEPDVAGRNAILTPFTREFQRPEQFEEIPAPTP